MEKNKQLKLAQDFQALHHMDSMFVLPNVWNGGSAKVFDKQGFKAVATTSAGIAYAMGYPDGEAICFEDLVRLTKEITRVIDIPLSVDMERGYGDTPESIARNVQRIIEAGAVGINIEDGYTTDTPYLEDLDKQIKKIEAISKLKETLGIPFVINARTCAFWLKIGDDNTRLEKVIQRCNAFASAGADCVFIPGAMDRATVKTLSESIHAPINIIANPMFHDFKALSTLGIKRLSIG